MIDEVRLVGVPKNQEIKEPMIDPVHEHTVEGVDLVYLQIDPSEYIARQRFLSHKCAMGKV